MHFSLVPSATSLFQPTLCVLTLTVFNRRYATVWKQMPAVRGALVAHPLENIDVLCLSRFDWGISSASFLKEKNEPKINK